MKNKMNLILAAVMCFVVADSAQAETYTIALPTETQLKNVYNAAKTKVATYVTTHPDAQAFVNNVEEKYNNLIAQNPQLSTDIVAAKDKVAAYYSALPKSIIVSI